MAASSLALTLVGCGGGSGGDGSSGSRKGEEPDPTPEELFCEAYEKCDPDYFSDQFDTVRECRQDYAEYLDDVESELGRPCRMAYEDLMSCFGRNYGRNCDYGEFYDRCEEQIYDAYDECFDYYNYYYY